MTWMRTICTVATITTIVMGASFGLWTCNVANGEYHEKWVTWYPSDDYGGDIWEDRIVYSSDLYGNQDIFYHNLTSGATTRLTDDPDDQAFPAIWGDKVVYEDYRNPNGDIYIYDLMAGTEDRLTLDPSSQFQPDIYDNSVVFIDHRHGTPELYLQDLVGGMERRITNDMKDDDHPSIWKDLIVWESISGSDSNITFYNISSGMMGAVVETVYDEVDPSIWEDHVAYRIEHTWQDIGFFDLSNGMNKWLTFDDRIEYPPCVFGSTVVYSSWDDGLSLMKFDMETGEEIKVKSYPGPLGLFPEMYGDTIVFSIQRIDSEVCSIFLDNDCDGVGDSIDAFPFDPVEFQDTDGDGLGDSLDPDADNDGTMDDQDAFPFDPLETWDYDNDMIGDHMDLDDDNDGIPDIIDLEPYNPLNAIQMSLDLLNARVFAMETNMTLRLNSLQNDLFLKLDLMDISMREHFLEVVFDLNGLNTTLNESEAAQQKAIDDFYKALTDLTGDQAYWREYINETLNRTNARIEVIMGHIDNLSRVLDPLNFSTTAENASKALKVMENLLEELDYLDDVIYELEELKKTVGEQNEDLEGTNDSMELYSLVTIALICISCIIIILFAYSLNRKKNEPYRDWE